MDALIAILLFVAVLAAALAILLSEARRSERRDEETAHQVRAMRAKIRAAASGQNGEKP